MSQLESLDPSDIKRRILGSWELPSHEEYAETINLYGSPSKFTYTCSATSVKERIRQILVGDEIHGNWHIRTNRRKSLRDSSASGSVRSSVSFSTNWLAPRAQTGKVDASIRLDGDDLGPFLVLNFTDITKSILNLNLLGIRLDVANWLNNFREIAEDDYLKIVSLKDNDTRLTLKGKRGIQVWRRFQESMGAQ
ncbi:hypothetical protein [Fortiea contorta]|uniref:hypothetical protein n=1 Tax=Fortiea contorta TaxID=1892405 RepID=UPI000349D2B9|nr:hypothetical protein [Fortiea contorta]